MQTSKRIGSMPAGNNQVFASIESPDHASCVVLAMRSKNRLLGTLPEVSDQEGVENDRRGAHRIHGTVLDDLLV